MVHRYQHNMFIRGKGKVYHDSYKDMGGSLLKLSETIVPSILNLTIILDIMTSTYMVIVGHSFQSQMHLIIYNNIIVMRVIAQAHYILWRSICHNPTCM